MDVLQNQRLSIWFHGREINVACAQKAEILDSLSIFRLIDPNWFPRAWLPLLAVLHPLLLIGETHSFKNTGNSYKESTLLSSQPTPYTHTHIP